MTFSISPHSRPERWAIESLFKNQTHKCFLNLPIFTFSYSSVGIVWGKEVAKHKLYTTFRLLSPESLPLPIRKGQGLLYVYSSAGKFKEDKCSVW